jgi:hypothetical protein
MTNKIDVKMGQYTASRIGKNAGKRPIKICCTSYWDKRKIFAKRTSLKEAGYNNVFVNEDLSKGQAEVFFHSRKAKQQKLIQTTWTQNGSIYVKMATNDIQLIPTLERLRQLVPLYKPPTPAPATSTDPKSMTNTTAPDEPATDIPASADPAN